jgi:hypothetical protein
MHKQLEMGSKLKNEKKKIENQQKLQKKQIERKFRQTPVGKFGKIFQRKTKQYHKKIQFHIKFISVKESKQKIAKTKR